MTISPSLRPAIFAAAVLGASGLVIFVGASIIYRRMQAAISHVLARLRARPNGKT